MHARPENIMQKKEIGCSHTAASFLCLEAPFNHTDRSFTCEHAYKHTPQHPAPNRHAKILPWYTCIEIKMDCLSHNSSSWRREEHILLYKYSNNPKSFFSHKSTHEKYILHNTCLCYCHIYVYIRRAMKKYRSQALMPDKNHRQPSIVKLHAMVTKTRTQN